MVSRADEMGSGFVQQRRARALYDAKDGWTVAGLLRAAVGGVWNYAVSSTLVWSER